MTVSAPTRLAALLVTAAAGLASTAAPASATAPYVPTGHECTLTSLALSGLSALGLDTGSALTDSLGYQFDTTSNLQAVIYGQPLQYATLASGGSKTAVAGQTYTGAYSNWGDLYVGDTESRATQYLSPDPLGCISEQSGQVAFAKTTIGSLKVQRKLLVATNGASGARLVESVENPTSAAITTNVFVGDLTSNLHEGTLGTGTATQIGQTSTGDAVIDGDDRWAVTYGGASKPALAHVWDGPGADLVHTTTELTGAQDGNEALNAAQPLGRDQFGYAWQSVTIPAGKTASFLSWELMRASTTSSGSGSAGDLAATAAANLSSASPATIFQGMTAAEIASVKNWAKPAVDATIAPITEASSTTDTTVQATSVDFGSSSLAQCSTGAVHWDFGDGTSATGMGGTHRFAAGQANVTVTVDGDCGGMATKHLRFWVDPPAVSATGTGGQTGASGGVSVDGAAASTDPPAPIISGGMSADAAAAVAAVAPAPIAATAALTPAAADPSSQLVLTALPKIAATQIQKKGVDATVQSAVGGSVRFVLTGTGIKMVKVVPLAAGPAATTTLKFPPSAFKALRTVKTLQLRAKLTLSTGVEIISTRPITVHH